MPHFHKRRCRRDRTGIPQDGKMSCIQFSEIRTRPKTDQFPPFAWGDHTVVRAMQDEERGRHGGCVHRGCGTPRLPSQLAKSRGWRRSAERQRQSKARTTLGPSYGLKKVSRHYSLETKASWRRGWDSNPRDGCPSAGFQDRCLKPLGHPSRDHSPLPEHGCHISTLNPRPGSAVAMRGDTNRSYAFRLPRRGSFALNRRQPLAGSTSAS